MIELKIYYSQITTIGDKRTDTYLVLDELLRILVLRVDTKGGFVVSIE